MIPGPKLLKSLEVKVRSVTTVAWEERKWGQGKVYSEWRDFQTARGG